MSMHVAGCAVDIDDCGDSAVRVGAVGEREAAWRVVHGIGDLLERQAPPGLVGTLATYDAVLVQFDCVTTDHWAIRASIKEVIGELEDLAPRKPRTFEIPVVYGGSRGPDLEATASVLGTTPADVVSIHTRAPLRMRCFGSPAGAPMMDGPAFRLPIPRLASPRPSVPAGAVAVAGRQAVISARPAPGGWHVLGSTPLTLIDPTRDPLTAYQPGDLFKFFAIDESEWELHAGVLT